MVKVIEFNGTYRVTIPKEIIKVIKWENGDLVNVELAKDHKCIIVRRMVVE